MLSKQKLLENLSIIKELSKGTPGRFSELIREALGEIPVRIYACTLEKKILQESHEELLQECQKELLEECRINP